MNKRELDALKIAASLDIQIQKAFASLGAGWVVELMNKIFPPPKQPMQDMIDLVNECEEKKC